MRKFILFLFVFLLTGKDSMGHSAPLDQILPIPVECQMDKNGCFQLSPKIRIAFSEQVLGNTAQWLADAMEELLGCSPEVECSEKGGGYCSV
jgi:hypothetical protein